MSTVRVAPLLLTHVTPDRVDAIEAPFLFLHASDVVYDAAAVERLVDFLLAHPDYAAVGPRLMTPAGNTVCTWSEDRSGGWFSRLDRRLRQSAAAPLASRDVSVLSAAALVVDREELLAYLDHTAPPLCWSLAHLWQQDARRLRLLPEVTLTWVTSLKQAPDLEEGARRR